MTQARIGDTLHDGNGVRVGGHQRFHGRESRSGCIPTTRTTSPPLEPGGDVAYRVQ